MLKIKNEVKYAKFAKQNCTLRIFMDNLIRKSKSSISKFGAKSKESRICRQSVKLWEMKNKMLKTKSIDKMKKMKRIWILTWSHQMTWKEKSKFKINKIKKSWTKSKIKAIIRCKSRNWCIICNLKFQVLQKILKWRNLRFKRFSVIKINWIS